MTLPLAKDLVLNFVIKDLSKTSLEIATILDMELFWVNAALEELEEEKKLELIEVSTINAGANKTFMVTIVTGRGKVFDKRESHEAISTTNSVLKFFKEWWPVIVLIVGAIIFILKLCGVNIRY